LRALRSEHLFDGKNAVSWMFVIMRNIRFSQMRRAKVAGEVALTGEKGALLYDPVVMGAQEPSAELSATLSAMITLPLEQVDTMVLMARGHDVLATAAMLGVAEGTIKSRVFRGRRRLRELVG
jgi:RNA polymerase sigma-70 factor (ECF subfamily)